MIPITPQIMGPGIEEEYVDLMERIEKLEPLFRPFPPSNDTAEGRMVYQLMWLRQELEARRLPIPLDQKYWGTLAYLIGQRGVYYLGGAKEMGEIALILRGTGLLKRRHYPVVIAMLDDFLAYLKPYAAGLNPTEAQFIEDTKAIRHDLANGALTLPLELSLYPGWANTFYPEPPHLGQAPDFGNRRGSLDMILFDGYRPAPCRKGNLPAPKPGMVWGTDT